MKEEIGFHEIKIDMELGPHEIDANDEATAEHSNMVRWKIKDFEREGLAPPGIFLSDHVGMLTKALGGAGERVWAKSKHEFFNPIRIGSKLIKRGRIADKYVKRGKRYLVYEVETVDNEGRLIMRSRETSFFGLDEGGENEG